MTAAFIPPAPAERPELFFALVGPVGADLARVTTALEAELNTVGYGFEEPIRLSHRIHGLSAFEHLRELQVPEDERLRAYMDAGDEIREEMGYGGALAALAIAELNRRRQGSKVKPETAFLFRSLKHPKEVETLRDVYGSSLIVISVFESEAARQQRLALRIEQSRQALLERGVSPTWSTGDDAAELARALIQRDQEDDEGSKFGQSVRKTFPHADFFLDAGTDLRRQIERLITVLFGHPQVSPSRDEYAMFMAQATALRSADMSRQVGAVIVDGDGEVVAAGCNEVPKPGGGVYWSGDTPDHRDFTQGSDPNALMGREILGEVFGRLKDAGWLVEAQAEQEPAALVEAARGLRMFERARIGNLIEFGRVVHAEMNALIYAARHGREVGDLKLYCTTFPCHVCARHLVGAGLSSVVYIEPYPKSLAVDLYPEAIALETKPKAVAFIPFTGVAPRRYMDFFGFGRRKDTHGYAVEWQPRRAQPRPRPLGSPYLFAEQELCDTLFEALEARSWI